LIKDRESERAASQTENIRRLQRLSTGGATLARLRLADAVS